MENKEISFPDRKAPLDNVQQPQRLLQKIVNHRDF